MNILIVHPFYYPNIDGGAEISIKLLAEGLVLKGHSVSVFTIDNKEKGIFEDVINGVKIYRSDSGKFRFLEKNNKESFLKKIINRMVGMNNLYVGKMFDNVVKKVSPDIIHINNITGISSIVWKKAKGNNVPVVNTIRDYWIIDPIQDDKKSKNIIRRLEIILHDLIYKKRSRNVEYVVTISRFMSDIIKKSGYFKNSRYACIYNAVNLDIELTKSLINQKKNRNNEAIKFLYAGRYSSEKGISNLLKAFTKVKNNNISIDFCGHGVEKTLINEYMEKDNRISDCGMLSIEELSEKYKEVDVVVVPSLWNEPFGRVVIEANQYGNPVIGSNRGGIGETIGIIQTGETYKYDDIDELAEKIELFSNRDYIRKFYDNIINNIEKYSIDNHVKEYENLFIEITKNQ